MSYLTTSNRANYELNKSSNNISSSFHTSFISQDTISNLKIKIFEKGQSRKDYQNLLSKHELMQMEAY